MILRLACVTIALLGGASAAAAQGSLANGSAASQASAQVVGDLAASGVQTVSAAAVLPASGLAAGSAVAGSVATGTGSVLTHAASNMGRVAGDAAATASGPLPVTREVIVAPQGPPHVPYDVQPGAPR